MEWFLSLFQISDVKHEFLLIKLKVRKNDIGIFKIWFLAETHVLHQKFEKVIKTTKNMPICSCLMVLIDFMHIVNLFSLFMSE